MINKIVSITNVGRFENYKHRGTSYDTLPQNVILYAENGSGKTTLSVLFKSLKGDNELLLKKKTFDSHDGQKVKLIVNGSVVNFENGQWSSHLPELEIFDTHFIEDNLYIGSVAADNNKSNLFDFIIGAEGRKLSEISAMYEAQWSKLFHEQIALQNPSEERLINKEQKKQVRDDLNKVQLEMRKLRPLLIQSRKDLGVFAKQIFETQIQEINNQLNFFAPYIQIKRFSNRTKRQLHQLSYYLRVNNTDVTFDLKGRSPSVKYSLSEGDKSAVALSFFLSKIYTSGDISNKVIVFDDPLSSFDANRRNTTIAQLYKLSKKIKQSIILTHDIYFARDISQKLGECLNLKVLRKLKASDITSHNIIQETQGGIFKDISILSGYIEGGTSSDEGKREVIRCLRPVIEGLIRIKYFDVVRKGEWLGDFISRIRQANVADPFHRLLPYLDEIVELNDYSKHFHHSEPGGISEEPINEYELLRYSRITLELMRKI